LPAQPESNAQPSFERDSRIHGVQQHTSTSMATSTVTSKQTVMHEVQSAYTTFGDGALAGANAGVKAGVAAGVTAAVSAGVDASVKSLASVSANELRTLMQRGRAGQDPRTDDRPILLAKVLRSDTSATLRRVAAWGLSEYASVPVAAEALANAVRHDANASVREMAAWSLGEANDGVASALDALTAAMRGDADTKVRATAAWSLGNLGDRAATDALVAALADASPEVRMRALWAIGNVEPKEAPHAVLSLLADKDARVRELAAWTLYQIEDPSAAPALDAALRAESNKDLQLAYIRALAALGEKSVDAIRGLLESNDPRIRTMAVKALAGGHAAGPWPWPWPEPRPYP
jgi:HEAT repeat protein